MIPRSNAYGPEPSREEIDSYQAPLVLQFGANWCSHCKAAEPLVSKSMGDFPNIHHIMVEDGKGRPLGRSFAVKLWPTLIFIKAGKEVGRLVRPESTDEIIKLLNDLNT